MRLRRDLQYTLPRLVARSIGFIPALLSPAAAGTDGPTSFWHFGDSRLFAAVVSADDSVRWVPVACVAAEWPMVLDRLRPRSSCAPLVRRLETALEAVHRRDKVRAYIYMCVCFTRYTLGSLQKNTWPTFAPRLTVPQEGLASVAVDARIRRTLWSGSDLRLDDPQAAAAAAAAAMIVDGDNRAKRARPAAPRRPVARQPMVFSTAMANKAAEAVVRGLAGTITEYLLEVMEEQDDHGTQLLPTTTPTPPSAGPVMHGPSALPSSILVPSVRAPLHTTITPLFAGPALFAPRSTSSNINSNHSATNGSSHTINGTAPAAFAAHAGPMHGPAPAPAGQQHHTPTVVFHPPPSLSHAFAHPQTLAHSNPSSSSAHHPAGASHSQASVHNINGASTHGPHVAPPASSSASSAASPAVQSAAALPQIARVGSESGEADRGQSLLRILAEVSGIQPGQPATRVISSKPIQPLFPSASASASVSAVTHAAPAPAQPAPHLPAVPVPAHTPASGAAPMASCAPPPTPTGTSTVLTAITSPAPATAPALAPTLTPPSAAASSAMAATQHEALPVSATIDSLPPPTDTLPAAGQAEASAADTADHTRANGSSTHMEGSDAPSLPAAAASASAPLVNHSESAVHAAPEPTGLAVTSAFSEEAAANLFVAAPRAPMSQANPTATTVHASDVSTPNERDEVQMHFSDHQASVDAKDIQFSSLAVPADSSNPAATHSAVALIS